MKYLKVATKRRMKSNSIQLLHTLNVGLIIAISIAGIGLIIGIIWAIKISRKKSTLDYMSTASSPDFDKFDKEQD